MEDGPNFDKTAVVVRRYVRTRNVKIVTYTVVVHHCGENFAKVAFVFGGEDI